jgi:hypothetical protein
MRVETRKRSTPVLMILRLGELGAKLEDRYLAEVSQPEYYLGEN